VNARELLERLAPLRVRLTLLYVALFGGSAALLLGVGYWLMRRHLYRTLPDDQAASTASTLLAQFSLAYLGTLVLAIVAGWLLAGRALQPLRHVEDTARRVSGDRLDERIALEGPADEIHRLSDALDDMLERLSESFEAQRRFVANASHELRTPMTLMRTEVEVALSDPNADERRLREMGEVVLTEAERTEALLDGLMTLARAQRALLRTEPLDLADCLRPAASLVSREAAASGIRLRVDSDSAPSQGDRRLLERLAANLMENAVRYNRPGGVVQASTTTLDGRATLRVENTGPHISPEQLGRLTAPFDRLDRHADGRGAGLGLSIARSVMDAHRGELRLEARPEGGLIVTAVLPAPGDEASPPEHTRRLRPGARTSATRSSRRPA
jgi:signal transduction histidine kinase